MTAPEEFFEAVKRGDLPSVRRWLAQDRALVNARAENGLSPVGMALYYGKDDVLNEILTHRPALSVHEAAVLGDLSRVRELVDANPGLADATSTPRNLTPLILAAEAGHADTVAYLLRMGADANFLRPGNGVTALTVAVAGGHARVVRLLIDAGADVNYRYEDAQFSPLITAAAGGDLAIVRMLVEAGADVQARTTDGKTALATAIAWENSEVVEYLRGLGAP